MKALFVTQLLLNSELFVTVSAYNMSRPCIEDLHHGKDRDYIMGMIAVALFLLSCAICVGFCSYFYKTQPPVFIHDEQETGHLVFLTPMTDADDASFSN